MSPGLPRIGKRKYAPSGRDYDRERIPAPFVVGLTRSGTTLLRMMLDSHCELTIPPETHFIPDLIKATMAEDATPESMLAAITSNRTWGDFGISEDDLLQRLSRIDRGDAGSAARCFYRAYAERQGKLRWGDKTPAYMLAITRIGRALGEARFVHLIRDGRDVALSQTARALNEQPPPPEQAARWVKRIGKAREQAAKLGDDRYLEVRYEDLVREPEPTLQRICEFVELDFDPRMLNYHLYAERRLQEMAGELREEGHHAKQEAGYRLANHAPTTKPPDPSKLDKWRREMPPTDLAAYDQVAGDLLRDLGYEVTT